MCKSRPVDVMHILIIRMVSLTLHESLNSIQFP